mmetsp:Transcript_150975/g.263834  ORF Transcript_150975/g.263834 Transcript_150975/m.263834 type:complete len:80 (-) Transcript_150975:7-246(-)
MKEKHSASRHSLREERCLLLPRLPQPEVGGYPSGKVKGIQKKVDVRPASRTLGSEVGVDLFGAMEGLKMRVYVVSICTF